MGTGANTKLNEPKNVKAQPYPNVSANGPAVNGRNVPIRHLDTITPVRAEAEYGPHASTMYADSGTMARSNVKPMRPTEIRRRATGNRKWAIQP